VSSPTLEDRFAGCLLGLAVGDALGARFEGRSSEGIAQQYLQPRDLSERPPFGELWYTDDTQMMIGVCETLIACGEIEYPELCRRFAENYELHRGYGRSTQLILEAIRDGHNHRMLAEELLPGGSFGNGAAMRVAPVGLAFRGDLPKVAEQARKSAEPTHLHRLGIEGAELLAAAVALASYVERFDHDSFFDQLQTLASSVEYAGPLNRARSLAVRRDLALFGNGIAATDSVVTAIASFARTPDNYSETIGSVILLGGDTDTMAAMAGAISGAYLGRAAIPEKLLDALEDGHKGRRYLETLARQLYQRFSA
jgi:poly(ADP-ribose) glycohydrolase ARH3